MADGADRHFNKPLSRRATVDEAAESFETESDGMKGDGQFYNPLSRRATVDEKAESFETESDGVKGDGQFYNAHSRRSVDEKAESFETESDGMGSSSFEGEQKSARSTQWGQLAAREALYSGDIDTAILVSPSCASSGLCHACVSEKCQRALLSASRGTQFWCQNACKSTWMDTTVLVAILFNTILLALENPANILAEETLLLMVAADTVLTVRSDSCSGRRLVIAVA